MTKKQLEAMMTKIAWLAGAARLALVKNKPGRAAFYLDDIQTVLLAGPDKELRKVP